MALIASRNRLSAVLSPLSTAVETFFIKVLTRDLLAWLRTRRTSLWINRFFSAKGTDGSPFRSVRFTLQPFFYVIMAAGSLMPIMQGESRQCQ
jgi:hypothetical protein